MNTNYRRIHSSCQCINQSLFCHRDNSLRIFRFIGKKLFQFTYCHETSNNMDYMRLEFVIRFESTCDYCFLLILMFLFEILFTNRSIIEKSKTQNVVLEF